MSISVKKNRKGRLGILTDPVTEAFLAKGSKQVKSNR